MRRALVPLALLALVLSGCADPSGADAQGLPLVDDEAYDGLQATSQTGVIRGVVVDEAIRPMSGATVQLIVGPSNRTTTSADSGAFGFADLPGGTYFLTVTKAGFKTVQQSAEVVAGESEPPIVKVLLVADPLTAPYFTVAHWAGYIECSFRVAVPGVTSLGVNACNDVGNQDVNYPLAPMDGVPDLVQGELVWDSTQSFGSGLSFVVGPPSCTDIKYSRADGESPLVIAMNSTKLLEESADALDDGFVAEEGVCYRVFSYVAGESQGAAGLVAQQQFEAYFHAFYHMVPPEGWQFSVDGDPPMA